MVATDQALIERVAANHCRDSFSILVARHQSDLRYSLRQMTGWNEALADDLAQETFIQAFKSLKNYQEETFTYDNKSIIKSNVHIGKNCIIGSNVIIENALLGDNVIIKSGTLIGQTGFGFNFEKKKRIKFPHIGRVIIENDVLIGSFCTIDRGSLTDTVVGEFTSLDLNHKLIHSLHIFLFIFIKLNYTI